jgi:hypothetical protein
MLFIGVTPCSKMPILDTGFVYFHTVLPKLFISVKIPSGPWQSKTFPFDSCCAPEIF